MQWTPFEFGRELVPGVNQLELHGDHVYFVSGPDYDAGGTGATNLHSGDRGRTWDPAVVLEDRAHDRLGGGLSGLLVMDDHELWVAGRNRQLFHSTDTMTSASARTKNDGKKHAISHLRSAQHWHKACRHPRARRSKGPYSTPPLSTTDCVARKPRAATKSVLSPEGEGAAFARRSRARWAS